MAVIKETNVAYEILVGKPLRKLSLRSPNMACMWMDL